MVNMAAEITGMLGACNSSRLCPNSWQLPAVQGSRWAPGGCLKVWLLQSGVCPLSFPSLPLNFITGCPAVTQSKFGLVQRKINCLVELLWPFIKGRGVFRFFSLLCYMEMRSRKNEMKSGKIEVGWSPKGSTAVTRFGQWSMTELYTQIMVVSSNSQIVRSIWIWCVFRGNNRSLSAALNVSSENVTDS